MNLLLAESLNADPRVAQAKQLIQTALSEHQSRLAGVRPADPARKASYDQMVERFGKMRSGALFYPYLGSGFGKGALVELADGSVKYDFITGIGVHAWGHSHPEMIQAGIDAALGDTIMQGNLQQNIQSVTLVQMLIDLARKNGASISHCFLSTSGAMANENALKIIFQKKHPASRLLAFEGCFMGRTLVLSQLTDKAASREGLPQTVSVDYVPYFDARKPAESTDLALCVLRQHLARYPGQHAAMCFELVQGEGGYYPGDRNFFVMLMNELKSKGVAVLADEVQTFGRTSQLFAFQHFDLNKHVDVVTIGKLSQVCATLFTDAFEPKPNLISQTFTGSTSSIYAAIRIIDSLAQGGFFGPIGRIAQVHEHFVKNLKAIGDRHPGWISGPFGLGAMIAFTPLDGRPETAKRFMTMLYEAGVIAFSAGSNPARVRFLVPIGAVTTDDIDAVCRIVEDTLARTAQG